MAKQYLKSPDSKGGGGGSGDTSDSGEGSVSRGRRRIALFLHRQRHSRDGGHLVRGGHACIAAIAGEQLHRSDDVVAAVDKL